MTSARRKYKMVAEEGHEPEGWAPCAQGLTLKIKSKIEIVDAYDCIFVQNEVDW
jgi:hypothetical protein